MRNLTSGVTTGVLAVAFALSALATTGYALLREPPTPAAAAVSMVTRPVRVAVPDVTRETRTVMTQKAVMIGYATTRTEQEQKKAHQQWIARRKHAAALHAAQVAQRAAQQPAAPQATSYPTYAGSYSYSGLERLWEANGGSAGLAPTAACIAEHESSGNPSAFNGRDIGLWQIDPGNDPGANLYNPDQNAAEAVRLQAAQGWAPWTTAPACGV